MVNVLTLAELQRLQRETDDKGIFAKYQNIRCRFCGATVFVPSWPYGDAQLSVYVPAARETMHRHGGCPECRPELDWEITSTAPPS
jgi:hypothetical protein